MGIICFILETAGVLHFAVRIVLEFVCSIG